ncbi:MAG: PLP-dependent transferase, partial [Dehalococcoidales bacterium]
MHFKLCFLFARKYHIFFSVSASVTNKHRCIMKRLPINYGFSSHAIHAGELTNDICQAHVAPIYQTSTFGFKDVEQGRRQFTGKEKGYIYSRWYNPTVEAIEEKVAALEGMELRQQAPSSSSGQALRHGSGQAQKGDPCPEVAGLAFSSGMAAISTLLFTLLRPGDTVITHGGLYGGTTELIEKLLPEIEISHVLVHMNEQEKL